MSVDRQAFMLFPSPNGGDMAIEIPGDFLPGLETLAACRRILIVRGPR
jgi:hypothetical protein